jgi:hypothetical protein
VARGPFIGDADEVIAIAWPSSGSWFSPFLIFNFKLSLILCLSLLLWLINPSGMNCCNVERRSRDIIAGRSQLIGVASWLPTAELSALMCVATY